MGAVMLEERPVNQSLKLRDFQSGAGTRRVEPVASSVGIPSDRVIVR